MKLKYFSVAGLVTLTGAVSFLTACTSDDESAIIAADQNAALKDSGKKTGNLSTDENKPFAGKSLPLPENTTYYSIRSFMDEYRDAYTAYIPLGREYRMFFRALNENDTPSEEALAALKLRMKENYDRAHWVYVGAIQELTEFLLDNSKNMLLIDKEDNFIARMKVVSFMGEELADMTKDAKYKTYTRQLYIYLNEKYFGRTVKTHQDGPKPEPTPTFPTTPPSGAP